MGGLLDEDVEFYFLVEGVVRRVLPSGSVPILQSLGLGHYQTISLHTNT